MERLKVNLNVLWDISLKWLAGVSSLITLLVSFFTWDDLGLANKSLRFIVLGLVYFFAFVGSIVYVLSKSKVKIYGDTNSGVTLCYDDILKLGFSNKHSQQKIIVIPVNRCFDMTSDKGLISPNSLHGKWIKEYIKDGDWETINEKVQEKLENTYSDYCNLTIEEKPEGNRKRFPAGTVVELKQNTGVTFYLLALASLDEHLCANCTTHDFYKAMLGLLDYYDKNGQQQEMFCPLMGDHITHPHHSSADVIAMMMATFRFNKSLIRGKVNIVIYNCILWRRTAAGAVTNGRRAV